MTDTFATRRLAAVGLVMAGLAGFVAGRVSTDVVPSVAAHSGQGAPTITRPNYPPTAPDQPAQEQVFRIADLKREHAERAAAARDGRAPAIVDYVLARTHSIRLLTRLPKATPGPSNITKRISLWDDAEQHQGVSDIYIVVDGGATVVVGGEIQDRQYRPTDGPNPVLLLGEFVGQPIVGGRSHRLAPGDAINIPPDIPHQVQPDPGGVSYLLIKVNVGLYPWGQAR